MRVYRQRRWAEPCDVCKRVTRDTTSVRQWGVTWDVCSDTCAHALDVGAVDPGNPLCVPPNCIHTRTEA